MEFKEWNMKAPWGNIALLSLGNSNSEPVLLVHGRLDSAATFIPLLKLLPKKYYYVLVDLPGNGKSDPFPKGMVLYRFLGVSMIDLIVQHLGWKEFIFIGHSLGAEQGLFYAAIYPKKVKKAIYLDIGPSLNYCNVSDHQRFFKGSYEDFYENFYKYDVNRECTKEMALRSILNARVVDEEEAELLLSRCLIPTGPNTYRLSWDRRYKITPAFNSLPVQFYLDLFCQHPIPTLFICANAMTHFFYQPSSISAKLMSNLTDNKSAEVVWVEGGHDVHLTNPERFIDELLKFLNKDFVFSKL